METEKQVESYLKQKVEETGGLCYKFMSPGRVAVPDRICVFPSGLLAFVECKGNKGKLTPKQKREVHRLQDLGHYAFLVNSKYHVDILILWATKVMSDESTDV